VPDNATQIAAAPALHHPLKRRVGETCRDCSPTAAGPGPKALVAKRAFAAAPEEPLRGGLEHGMLLEDHPLAARLGSLFRFQESGPDTFGLQGTYL